MSDIIILELVEAIEDEALKAWWGKLELPADFTMNEFFIKTLEAASIAAAKKNEALPAGNKILSYPPATNGPVTRAAENQMFVPRTSTVTTRLVISLDMATPVVGG
jgi:hypothetical protein